MSDIRKRKFAEDTIDEDLGNLYDSLSVDENSSPQEKDLLPEAAEDVKGFFGTFGSIASDIGGGIMSAPRSVERGIVGAFEGVAELGEDLDRAINSPVLQIFNEKGELDFDITNQEEMDARFGGEAPGLGEAIAKLKLDKPESPTFTSEAVEGITQFVVGFKGVDKLVKGAKMLPAATSGVSKVASTTVKGAVADMFVFDEQEQRLSNLVESVPELQNPVTNFLKADEGDGFAEAKFKQGLEGVGFGLFAESLVPAIKVLKRGKQAAVPLTKDAYKQLSDIKSQFMKDVNFSDEVNASISAVVKKDKIDGVLSGDFKVGGKVGVPKKGFEAKAAKVKDELVTRVFGKAPAEFDKDLVLKSAGLVDDPVVSDLMKFASEKTPKTTMDWGEVEAKALGMSVDEAKARFGTVGDFTAGIQSVKNEAISRAARLAERINAKGLDDGDSLDALADFLEISSVEKMMSSEAGRALGSLRKTKNVSQVLSSLDVTSKSDIEAILKSFGDDPEKLLTFGRQLGRSKSADIKAGVHSYWINSVLSGPVTHATNISANLSFLALRPLERLGAAGVGVLTGSQKTAAKEALEMYHGYYEGFRDAMRVVVRAEPVDKELKKIVGRGTKFDDVGDVSAERGNMLLGKAITGREETLSRAEFLKMGPMGMGQELLARALTAPTDFLGATDQFMKTMAARGQKRTLAYRSAVADGLEGQDFADRMDSILNNTAIDASDKLLLDNINEAAGHFARETVFQDDLGKIGNAVIGIRDNVPGMEYVIPFVKTPLNILDETFLKRTPLGLASGRVRGEILGGGAKAEEAIAKMAIGTAVSGSIVAAYTTGNITGAGPKGKAARDRWLETHQPWSIKLEDKWYAYNKIEPVGSLIGLGARLGEVIEHNSDVKILDPEEEEELAFGLAGAFSKYVTDKSMMANVDNVLSALEGDKFAVEQFTANVVGGFVPFSGAVRSIKSANDKELRDMDGILDRIQSGLPGLSESLPHRRNRFGDKIIAADRTIGVILPISHTPGGVSDKLTQRINEIEMEGGFILSKPSDKMRGVKLTPEEQDRRLENFGTFEFDGLNVKQAIIDTAEREEFKAIGTARKGGQADIIKRIYRSYLKAADEIFIEQNPELSVKMEKVLKDNYLINRELNPRTGEPKEKETYIGAQ